MYLYIKTVRYLHPKWLLHGCRQSQLYFSPILSVEHPCFSPFSCLLDKQMYVVVTNIEFKNTLIINMTKKKRILFLS